MSTPKQIDTPDTEPPDHPPSPEETASKLGVIAAVCFLLPVLYFLSTGPVIWAIVNGYTTSTMEDHFDTFYSPLKYLKDSWEPFSWLLEQYLRLWVDLP